MVVNSSNKTKKVLAIVFAVVGILLVIGGSYALWTYNFTGGQNIIEVDSISLELLESNDEVISIEKALPKADKDGIAQSEAFSFAVTTRTEGVTDIYYNLKIEKVSVDSGYTAFSDNDIKIYLTDENDKALIAPRRIGNLNNYTFYKTYNKHTGEEAVVTTKYKLKAWIDYDVDASNWTENTKLQYKFKIGVEGEEYNSSLVNLSNKVIPEGAYYISMDAETGAPTIQTEIPATVSENDMYVYGDYMYVYMADAGGWAVLLATEESFGMFGATEVLADYPVTDKNQTSYDQILETVNGVPVTVLYATFNGCTALEEIPVVPKSVMMSIASFIGTPALKSNTNIYSYNAKIYEASTLDTITNYTTDYKTLNKPLFLKHNIGSSGKIESQEVCYILNNKKYCLKGGGIITNLAELEAVSPYYEENKATLFESFGEENCSVYSDYVLCSLSAVRADAYDNGSVYVYADDWTCRVNDIGVANCFEL